MTAILSLGGIIRPSNAPLSSRPIYLRNGGDDEADGSSIANAVATPVKAIKLLHHGNSDHLRQYIEATGFTGSFESNAGQFVDGYTLPSGGNRGANETTRPGAFDNGKVDVFTAPVEFYADPTLVLAITASSWAADADNGLQTLTVTETLTPNAHVGEYVSYGNFDRLPIKSNTANEIVLACSGKNYTGAAGIYTQGCTIALNTYLLLRCPATTIFNGIKFTGSSWLEVYPKDQVLFSMCNFENAGDVQFLGAGRGIVLNGCYVDGPSAMPFEGTYHELQNVIFLNSAIRAHGSGGAGRNTLTDAILDGCEPYGTGNHESAQDIEVNNVLVENATSYGIHVRSPYNSNLNSVKVNGSALDGVLLSNAGGFASVNVLSGTSNGGVGLKTENGARVKLTGTNDITGTGGDVDVEGNVRTWAYATGDFLNPSNLPMGNSLTWEPATADLHGPYIYTDWDELMVRLAEMKVALGPTADIFLKFSASNEFRVTPPVGGPWPMENVWWTAHAPQSGTWVIVDLQEGATFTGLRRFSGSIHVNNLATITPPDQSIEGASGTDSDDRIILKDKAKVTSPSNANVPIWRVLNAAHNVGVEVYDNAELGPGAAGSPLIDGANVVEVKAYGDSIVYDDISDVVALQLRAYGNSFISLDHVDQVGSHTQSAFSYPKLTITNVRTTPTTSAFGLNRYDTTAGNVVHNLPAANDTFEGTLVWVKNYTGANNVTVTPNGVDTVDDVAGTASIGPGLAAGFVSDGISDWTQI